MKDEFQIEELIKVLIDNSLTEFSYEEKENLKIKIKKSPQKKVVENKQVQTSKNMKEAKAIQKEDVAKTIVSPAIGRYYYEGTVKVGDRIKVGQNLGNIHTMGIKTPLKATVSGEILEIVVENGGVVDYGKVLLKIKGKS